MKSNTFWSTGAKDLPGVHQSLRKAGLLFSSWENKMWRGEASGHTLPGVHGNKDGPGDLLLCGPPVLELIYLNTFDGLAV